MNSTTVRRTALGIAAAAALTSVAACGSAGGTGKSDKAAGGGTIHVSPIAAVLRTAEQSTDKANSATVRSTMSVGDVISTSSTGSLRWGDGLRGDLTITYTGGRLAEAMRKNGAAPAMHARYLPDAYYVNMGAASAQRMGGRHWLKYAYDDLAKFGGASGSYMKDQIQTATPNSSVQMLLASGDVKKVGEEPVSGARATHYSGTVNVADLAGRSSNLTAEQMSALKAQLDTAGITTETIDIWINDQNLLVKKSEKAHTAKGELTNTASYSDYGVQVSAEAPPAGDTKDFKDLMNSLGTPGSGNVASGSASAS
ncbi:hypothetical protein BIV25_18075 [Streptomyces sp. MUSC 14]|uniref:hypothetical protein n=1 Tax=Streptomyces sp. MUSC 14 TaxID=1354889 RepID=UPI0008F5DCA4|nr:hypothetical protein [Streptomyces sp. MUSC 14]OIJ96474.1 hypothetical protein BIV25_18075 [Streptomyces sp. MUSC 14]